MKKNLLSLFLLLFYAVGLNATDHGNLNIYASGLDVSQTSGVTTIDYVLNAPATSLSVKLYDGETLIKTITIPAGAEDVNYAKGAHAGVALDLTGVSAGEYTWSMVAAATGHDELLEATDDLAKFAFYAPRDVVVDNSTESDFFGNIYVSNANDNTARAGSSAARYTAKGIFILDAQLNSWNSSAYAGNVSWTGTATIKAGGVDVTGQWGPYRMAIDEEGLVYITDNGAPKTSNTGVFRMNPARPDDDFVSILGGKGSGVYNCAHSLAVTGKGTERVLYLNDWADYIRCYPIGNSTGYTSTSSNVVKFPTNCQNRQNSIARDNNGGFWICQVSTYDANPELAHFSSGGEAPDYYISRDHNSGLSASDSNRGAVGLNPSNTLVAFGGGGVVNVFEITYSNGISLTKKAYSPSGFGNIDGLAFDVADNLYVVSASTERLEIFATPKPGSSNTYETKAQSSKTITVSYSRSSLTVDNLSTICLPYAVDAAALWGAEVYEVASATSNAGVLQYITLGEVTDGLVAGKPYFIKPTSTIFSCVYNGDEEDEVQAANGLVGKLSNTDETVPADGTCYILKDGLLHKVPGGVTVSFVRNRAYFDLDEYVGPVSAPGQRMLTVPCAPEISTDMEKVENGENVTKYFRDGQLYIRREGVTYDALGRVVR